MTDQGPLGHDYVRAHGVQRRIHEEVLLLPAEEGVDELVLDPEVLQDLGGGLGDGGLGLQEGSLVVQGLSGV